MHPAQAFKLIRAQRRIQSLRRFGREIADVAQALGEGADLLAAFPQQRQAFQRIEPGGVSLAQAQGGFARLLQIKLAQRHQYRLQATERQRHLQRPMLAGALRNVHQNQLVIATAGEAFRVEDLGVRAHQIQQDRQ